MRHSLRSKEEKSEGPLSSFKMNPAISKDTQNTKAVLDISFLVPCYNEARNVTQALETIQSVMAVRPMRYEVLVIDDGSADETGDYVRTYQAAHPDLPIRLYRNDTNQGLGFTYFQGAAMTRGEYYMIVNGDGDLPTETILKIIDRKGEADIINPYLTNQYDRPLIRQIISFLFTNLVALLGGHRLHYYNGPVLHRRTNVLGMKTKTIGFGYQAELLCTLLRKGCSVIEIPFTSAYRHHQTDAFRLQNILSVLKSLYRIFLTRMIQG